MQNWEIGSLEFSSGFASNCMTFDNFSVTDRIFCTKLKVPIFTFRKHF